MKKRKKTPVSTTYDFFYLLSISTSFKKDLHAFRLKYGIKKKGYSFEKDSDSIHAQQTAFFIKNQELMLSYDAEIKDNNFYFSKHIKRGGHSTLRVFFLEKKDSEQDALFKELNLLGVTIERASDQLIAIDVPPNTDLKPIIELLQSGESNGTWSYEEGYIYK